MLLPVLQLVLLWWTFDLIECHGDVFIGFTPFLMSTAITVPTRCDKNLSSKGIVPTGIMR